MEKKPRQFFARLHDFIDRPWYFPLITLLTALDPFIWIIPIEPLLISEVLLRPRRWVTAAIAIGTASALGAGALAWGIETNAGFLPAAMTNPSDNSSWARVREVVEAHGAAGIWFGAFTFVPLQAIVIIAALAKIPTATIFLSVLAARLPKYLIIAAITSHAPHWLQRLPFLKTK